MRSIPPDLLAKIKKQNQTIYENADPKMSVVIARARSSVRDSSYFMIEKIREKEGITDIAVSARRLLPYGSPDRIYGIHIDNGMAKTSIREYPDKLKEHWKHQFDVASAKGVSICFDARWQMSKYKRWGMATSETPWIFWIGTDDKLYARIWDNVTPYVLDEDVVLIDTVRGWIPAQAGHTDDQGIIAAYIKTDGKVYYRNYCMQSDGETFIWESRKEITEFGTGNLGIRLFRTNDFRVGFIAENPNGNMMALTKRNYAGMSIAPESLHAKLTGEIWFIPIEKISTETREYLTAELEGEIQLLCVNPFNMFTFIENIADNEGDYGKIILFRTKHKIYGLNKADFELTDSQDVEFSIESITKIGDRQYKLELFNFNNAYEKITLTFKGLYGTNEAGYLFDEFSIEFMPTNLEPDDTDPPEVEAIWND